LNVTSPTHVPRDQEVKISGWSNCTQRYNLPPLYHLRR